MDAFFFCAFSSATFCRGVSEGVRGRFWCVDDGVRRGAVALVGIPVLCSEFIRVVPDGDGVTTVGANDSSLFVLVGGGGVCGIGRG